MLIVKMIKQMKIISLLTVLFITCLIPIVYSLSIYQPNNCSRYVVTAHDELESLKNKNVKMSLQAQSILDNVSFAEYNKANDSKYFFFVCKQNQPILFLNRLRGLCIKNLEIKSNDYTVCIFKNAKGKIIGEIKIIMELSGPRQLVTKTNSNKDYVSLPLVSNRDVMLKDPSLIIAEQLANMIKSSSDRLVAAKAIDFIVQQHVEGVAKQKQHTIGKIILRLNNFINESRFNLENTQTLDYYIAWDNLHGIAWSLNSYLDNTVHTLNTKNEDIFPSIVEFNDDYTCSCITTNCKASIDVLYKTDMSVCKDKN